jgi:predicted AlkP superfamily phosphohydrolase/phosphomutase
MKQNKNKKVVVIGFDGATFDLIKPWAEQGELPNFARLMNEGAYGELQSTQPPISPQAWASFMTGTNAGKHGIYNFQEREPGSYNLRFINARSRRGKTLWRILSEAGKKVIVIGVPCTYPPEKVNGLLVSGFDCPSTNATYTYPERLTEEIEKTIGEYVIDVRIKSAFRKGNRDFLVEEIKGIEKKRFDLFFHFLERYDWDFAIAVFMATDRAQHYFWKYMDPKHPSYDKKEAIKYGNVILDVYKQGDHLLGKILEKIDNNVSIVVMSDHGFGPGSNKVFYPNKWLRQEGLLYLKDEESQRGHLTKISRGLKKLTYSVLRKTKNAMVKNLPREMKETIMHRLSRARGKLQSYLFFSHIDWTRTKAFSDEMWDAIWINLKGREPEGIVEPEVEYEKCRDEIIEKLLQLKEDNKGEYIVDKVYKREELYHGPLTYKLPDLTFTLKDFKYRIRPSGASVEDSRQGVLGEVDIEDRPSGSHRPKGIFILRGNEFKHNAELKHIHIMDLAPTILHVMGLPIPTDMDGKFIRDAFKTECLPEYVESAGSSVQREDVSPYTDEESEEISKNLKQLGYME